MHAGRRGCRGVGAGVGAYLTCQCCLIQGHGVCVGGGVIRDVLVSKGEVRGVGAAVFFFFSYEAGFGGFVSKGEGG